MPGFCSFFIITEKEQFTDYIVVQYNNIVKC